MIPLHYDLHLHSCLSPCGDNESTPGNIVGMAVIKGLDVIALTDHNTCKNCKAAMAIGEAYGITVIPGMELTTSEEVHVLCLFYNLEDAMKFDAFIEPRILDIPNNPKAFGDQFLCNEDDEVIGSFPKLLISATDISFDKVYDYVSEYHGVMIPAHIDKNSFSLMSNLGFVPPDSKFKCFELADMGNLHRLQKENEYLKNCNVITDSDAHYIEKINEPINTLYAESNSIKDVLDSLIRKVQ
ncbi:MAG: PHP domain-containing protein [Lachnospiraceae bacterium]|nr:PHP domain-containing protein [Lachnospiraceae bacterium]MBP5565452.1 PHP domain-containing protein [Lachnospiraceae bacterium]